MSWQSRYTQLLAREDYLQSNRRGVEPVFYSASHNSSLMEDQGVPMRPFYRVTCKSFQPQAHIRMQKNFFLNCLLAQNVFEMILSGLQIIIDGVEENYVIGWFAFRSIWMAFNCSQVSYLMKCWSITDYHNNQPKTSVKKNNLRMLSEFCK